MVISKAKLVADYLESLPADRRQEIAAVRKVIRKHLPKGYEEAMTFGLISYQVPLKKHRETYNGQPLCYVGLAAQKNFNSLYLMRPYSDPQQRKLLEESFVHTGKKLEMGKSCIRFTSAEDLPLDAIGRLVASTSPDEWIALANTARRRARSKSAKSSK